MEKDTRLLAAAIFALAAAYFLTNLNKAVPENDTGGVWIHNTITGSVKWCHPQGCVIPEPPIDLAKVKWDDEAIPPKKTADQ
jgi:hypothetical protein